MDKVIEWLKGLIPLGLDFVLRIFFALILLFIGRRVIKLLIKAIKKSLERANMDKGVIKFVLSASKGALYIVLFLIMANVVGVQTTSLVAIVGSAGLAIGLALQGSLANFAGGVLIFAMKPFTLGDYIICGADAGTVKTIDIFYTRLLTPDNRVIVIPNGTLMNSSIQNNSSEPFRVLEILVPIEYDEDIDRVKKVLFDLANRIEGVEKDKEYKAFVNTFDTSSVSIGFQTWVKSADFLTVKRRMMEEVKKELDKENISIPYEHFVLLNK